MLHCRPAPDFLPDPEACLLTGILPQQCLEQGLPEHAFAAAIEAQLARPGTVGVGYNSIRFDDEVTRFLFWRNLIDPYAREWQNRLRPLGPAGRGALRLCAAPRRHRVADARRRPRLVQARAPDARQRPGARRRARRAVRRARHHRAGAAAQDAPAPAVGLLPEAAQEGRGAGRDRAAQSQGRPFLHVSGMYRRRARLPGDGVAAGAAPDQQERDHRLGPGARPGRAADARRRGHAPAHVQPQRRPARGRDAAADQDHPHQQVAGGHRQPEDADAGDGEALGHRCRSGAAPCRCRGAACRQAGRHVARGVPAARRDGPADVDEDLYGGFVGNDDRRTLQRLRALDARRRWPTSGRPSTTRGWRNCCSATARATSRTR